LKAVGVLVVSSTRGTSVVDLVSRPQALNTKATAVVANKTELSFNFAAKRLLLISATFFLIFINLNLHKSSNKVYSIHSIAV
jgi:hypothetical protein